jgi:hypothetical protein
VVVNTFTAPAASIDVMNTALSQAYAAIELAAGAAGKSCVPTTETIPDRLSGETRLNLTTKQIAYRWHGPGYAFATKDCASAVTVKVTVTDLAAAGSPARIRGATYTATNNYSGTKAWGATATTNGPDVVYFDPAALYARGNSTVFISVAGSYRDKATGKSIPLPCNESATQVTPTPDGPLFGTVTSGPCGNSAA